MVLSKSIGLLLLSYKKNLFMKFKKPKNEKMKIYHEGVIFKQKQ